MPGDCEESVPSHQVDMVDRYRSKGKIVRYFYYVYLAGSFNHLMIMIAGSGRVAGATSGVCHHHSKVLRFCLNTLTGSQVDNLMGS